MDAPRAHGIDCDDLRPIVRLPEKDEMRRDPCRDVCQLSEVPRLDPCGAYTFPAPSGPVGRGEKRIDGLEGEVLQVVNGGREGVLVDCLM